MIFVDLYSAACISPVQARVFGYRRRLTIPRPYDLDESFHMIPSLDSTDENSGCTCETRKQKVKKSTFLSGDKVCPLPYKGKPPVITSACPYYYQLNYDRYRIPQYIAEVQCSCDDCITIAPNASKVILHDGACDVVKIPRQVLRRCKNKMKYMISYEKYAVACTCRFRKVVYG